jgi:hypothetical protein
VLQIVFLWQLLRLLLLLLLLFLLFPLLLLLLLPLLAPLGGRFWRDDAAKKCPLLPSGRLSPLLGRRRLCRG